jgi:branched-chain amino acid transport system ATP-binding protein
MSLSKPESENALLAIEALRVDYGAVAAVKGVSLAVGSGEVVALLGANGAGKSTMLRTISGLVRARSGRIRFAGVAIERLAPPRIVRLGLAHCPEGRRIFGSLSVAENLRLGAAARADRASAAADRERLFELFPVLRDRAHQAAGTLSGGEQQMLALARALMARPRLLLLDEPSLGLAPLMVQAIFATLAALKRDGVTMLLVEQNMTLALQLADRAYVLRTGEIRLSGSAAALQADQERVAEAYLGAA